MIINWLLCTRISFASAFLETLIASLEKAFVRMRQNNESADATAITKKRVAN